MSRKFDRIIYLQKNAGNGEAKMAKHEIQAKYPKPKIMLIDMDKGCTDILRNAGYSVREGSFGVPYSVPCSGSLYQVPLNTCTLPNFEEQEIIFLNCDNPAPKAPSMEPVHDGVEVIWQSAESGQIDPRPITMTQLSDNLRRILQHDGILVVMLVAKESQEYLLGAKGYGGIDGKKFESSNWSFNGLVESCSSQSCFGSEIEVEEGNGRLSALLKKGITGAEYHCNIRPYYGIEDRCAVLARNKFGETIGLAFSQVEDRPFNVFLLPQMPSLSSIILQMVEEVFSSIAPKLFPHLETARWTYREEYEVPKITELLQKIETVKEDARRVTEALSGDVQRLREENKNWYALLNGTGDELVVAVIAALQEVGFKQVHDIDAEAAASGETGNRREDIQIRDISPVLVIDVKGITGTPEDAEATQSEKHAYMRRREFAGDVKALTIVNHQRNIPPHDRNPEPYREEIVKNAEMTELGLMTTWDLFRVLRNMKCLGWTSSVVTPIFYRKGRIEVVPEHYIELGRIAKVWKEAIGVVVEAKLEQGWRVAVEAGDLFIEFDATSLQVAGKVVKVAKIGDECGIAYSAGGTKIRAGMRVFVVRGTTK